MVVLFIVLISVLGLLLWQQQQEAQLLKKKLLSLQQVQEVLITKAVLKSQEEERQRFARDWHDNMGNLLSTARLLTDTIQTNNPQPLLQVQQLLENAHQVAKDVCFNSQIISIHSQQDLTAYCKEVQSRLQLGGLAFNYTIAAISYERLSNPQKEHFSNILKELITNVIKHAEATAIQLTVQSIGDQIQLEVIDNGKGFGEVTTRFPRTIKDRIGLLNGTIKIKNNLPSGTIITVNF